MTGPKIVAPKKPPRSVRPSEYEWNVRIFLGDQCGWYIAGPVVHAVSEARAIAIARNHLFSGWPQLDSIIESAPAIARQRVTG